jgi:hypothetical protein
MCCGVGGCFSLTRGLTMAASPWAGSPVLGESDVVREQNGQDLRMLPSPGDALAAYSARLALA